MGQLRPPPKICLGNVILRPRAGPMHGDWLEYVDQPMLASLVVARFPDGTVWSSGAKRPMNGATTPPSEDLYLHDVVLTPPNAGEESSVETLCSPPLHQTIQGSVQNDTEVEVDE